MSGEERVWVRRLVIAAVVGLVWAFVVPRVVLVVAERSWFVRFQPTFEELDTVRQFGLHYHVVAWHDPVTNVDGSVAPAWSDTRLGLGWPFYTYDTAAVVVEDPPIPGCITIRPDCIQPWALKEHASRFTLDVAGAVGNVFAAFVGTMVLLVVVPPVLRMLPRRTAPAGYCLCGYKLCGLRAGACCPECGRGSSVRRLRTS